MRSVATDEITATHRTRLSPAGVKLGRRMLGIAAGSAIKLDAEDALTHGLTIGEGIETVLAARQLGFRPAWAMGSVGGIASFPLLPGIERSASWPNGSRTDRRTRPALAPCRNAANAGTGQGAK